ncbi:hypothetical protein L1987_22485 [Smallanthus sonchifolius]|uniref:Uncharacterized protein n=1 Tax=Smallanthus sonchifolius TaxID=185202 RepID=A0ACB9IGG9_9ASTR|nr:hypothetical protein L1987_22485 [Smallanthus sonchifolius]
MVLAVITIFIGLPYSGVRGDGGGGGGGGDGALRCTTSPASSPPTTSLSTSSPPPPTPARPASVSTAGTHTTISFGSTSFQTPDFISPRPNPNATTQFPTHLQPSFNSSLHLRGTVGDVIRSLAKTSRRVVVVHDSAMSYVVQDVKFIPNAETYIFRALSVFCTLCNSLDRLGRELPFEPEMIPHLPPSTETMSQEFMEFVNLQYSHQTFHVGNLYDSLRVIEGEFLETLERDEIWGKNHWAVGPFNQVEIQPDVSNPGHRQSCLKWLDKQPERSVIYVSYGTTTTFTESQIRELAVGLENSEQRFLWVLRDADKGDVFANEVGRTVVLPEGFEDSVEGRGL